jgi:hypothetical protein
MSEELETTVDEVAVPTPEPAPELVDETAEPEVTPESFDRATRATDPSEPEQDGEQLAVEPDAAYNLSEALPPYAPKHIADDPYTEASLHQIGGWAKQAGIAAPVAKTLVGVVADLALAEQDAVPPTWDKDAVEQHMRRELGDKAYEDTVRAAGATVKRMGPGFADWLFESGWGNVPAMVHALAALGPDGLLTKNTPDHARQAMQQIRAKKDHPVNKPGAKGRGAALVQWRLLSALANMGDQSVSDGDASERRSERDGKQAMKDRKAPPKESSPRVRAEEEAKSLMRSSAWNDRRDPSHRAVAERVRELFRKAYPEGKD